MLKGRRWRALQQTCNMTPCSLYRPTSHNSTSSTSLGVPDQPRREYPAPDQNDDPGRDRRRILRAPKATLRMTVKNSIPADSPHLCL